MRKEFHTAGSEWHNPVLFEYYPAVDNFLPTFYMHWGRLGLLSRKEIDSLAVGIPFFADLDASLDLKSLDGTSAEAPVSAPDAAWSSDGKQIAYSSLSDGHNFVLYVATLKDNHAGTARALTEPALEAHSPVWSVDGSHIAFTGLWKGSQQLFAINADGTGLIQVSRKNDRSCSHPSWSPDGTLIVAECHQNVIYTKLPYFDILGWYSSIYLFDMNKPNALPRVVLNCGDNPRPDLDGWDYAVDPMRGSVHRCGAHNPSFAPLEAAQ
jgi:WD40 repeat protein